MKRCAVRGLSSRAVESLVRPIRAALSTDEPLHEDLVDDGLSGSAELGLAATPGQAAVAVAAGEAIRRSVTSGAPVDVARLLNSDGKVSACS